MEGVIVKNSTENELEDLKMILHDFVNQITTVMGFVEIMLNADDLPEKHKEKLKYCCEKIKKHYNITKNFIIDSREQDIKKIKEIAREVLNEFDFEDIHLITSLNDINIKTKPRILKTVIRNFVSNSLRELKKKNGNYKKLIVETGIENAHNLIKVEDNGYGILEHQLDEIFKKGVSFSDSTGEGLHYCLEKAKELGGGIDVHSKINENTSFTFKIPINSIKNK